MLWGLMFGDWVTAWAKSRNLWVDFTRKQLGLAPCIVTELKGCRGDAGDQVLRSLSRRERFKLVDDLLCVGVSEPMFLEQVLISRDGSVLSSAGPTASDHEGEQSDTDQE